MDTHNILLYNRGEQINYIPQIDPFVYFFMLEALIKTSVFVSSIEDGFVENSIYTQGIFEDTYNNINEEILLEIIGEKAFSKVNSCKFDYMIITFPWFNYALKEVILISKYIKKYINSDLKTIYISEFPKFYENEILSCFPEEFDYVISGGHNLSRKDMGDPIMKQILSYSKIQKGGTYNFPAIQKNIIPKTDMIEYQISRGCIVYPRCFYCTISDITSAPLYSHETLMGNLQILLESGIKKIYFIDGELNFDNALFEKVLDFLIKNDIKITWSSYILTKNLSQNLIEKMYESGCRHVRVGIESATPNRMKTISKNLQLQEALDICKKMHNVGIIVQAHFIYGFKGETSRELKTTMDFIQENKDVFDIVDFFYLKFRPKVGSYPFNFQKFELPFVKDDQYMDTDGNLTHFTPGDGSIIDKKSYLFQSFLKLIGKQHKDGSLGTDPRKFFLDHM